MIYYHMDRACVSTWLSDLTWEYCEQNRAAIRSWVRFSRNVLTSGLTLYKYTLNSTIKQKLIVLSIPPFHLDCRPSTSARYPGDRNVHLATIRSPFAHPPDHLWMAPKLLGGRRRWNFSSELNFRSVNLPRFSTRSGNKIYIFNQKIDPI